MSERLELCSYSHHSSLCIHCRRHQSNSTGQLLRPNALQAASYDLAKTGSFHLCYAPVLPGTQLHQVLNSWADFFLSIPASVKTSLLVVCAHWKKQALHSLWYHAPDVCKMAYIRILTIWYGTRRQGSFSAQVMLRLSLILSLCAASLAISCTWK